MMLNLLLDIYLVFNLSLNPLNRAGQVLGASTFDFKQQDLNLDEYRSLSLIASKVEDVDKIALAKQINLEQKQDQGKKKAEEKQNVKPEVKKEKKEDKKDKEDKIVKKPKPAAVLSPAQLDPLFTKYSQEYGVSKQVLIKIAKCESGFNSNAQNGPYGGMFQFLASTWISNRRAMGLNPDLNLRYNAEESIKTAAFKISRDGTGAWPVCGH